jgi:hypothetical protein
MKTTRIKNLLLLLVLLVLLASLLGVNQGTIDRFVDLFVRYLLIPAIVSLATGSLVEVLTGDTLKTILFVVDIRGFKFSITAFAIAVAVLNFVIFRT